MIIIYFKIDGEIHQVAPGYKTIEEYYGVKAEEFKKIFDYIYIDDINYFIFNNFAMFKVINNELVMDTPTIMPYVKINRLGGDNIEKYKF